MYQSIRLRRAIVAGAVFPLMCAAGAFAQEQIPEEAEGLEEIVVTAERRAADLQQTSMSIQVFSGDQLRAQGKKRLDEIMRGVTGVASQGSQVGDSFFMRGIGIASGPQPPGTSTPVVAVLIDGVYQNRGEVVRGGSVDMSQVEVMRGTQSTTLGASSFAGAVSVVSNDPVFDLEGRGGLQVGNYDLINLEGVLNVPLADNQAFRVAYSRQQRDGYISSGAGDSDLTNYRIKYRWQPNDNVNIVLTAAQNKIGGNGVDTSTLTYGGYWEPYDPARVAVTPPGPPGPSICNSPDGCYDVTMGVLFGHINDGTTYRDRSDPWDDGYPKDIWPNNPFRDTTIDQYSINFDWTTGIGVLSIKPSFQKAHFISQEPPRGTDYRAENRKQETSQLDVQLTSEPGHRLTWLAGLYLYDTELDGSFQAVGFPGFGAGPSCPSVSPTENSYCWSNDVNSHETFSAYANGAFSVTDEFRIIAGVRYSEDEKTFVNNPDTPGDILGPPSSGYPVEISGSRDWDDVTYRVGLEYDLTDGDSMAYAVYATGYQAGNIFSFNPSGTDAETLEQVTLGYKSRWLSGRLQLNIEYFNSEYHDRPLDGSVGVEINEQFAPPFPACSAFPVPNPAFYDPVSGYACYQVLGSTVPDLFSEGWDIELNWLITDRDRIDLSVQLLDSTITEPEPLPSEAEFNAQMNAAGLTDPATLSSMYSDLSSLNSSYDGLTNQNSPETSVNLTYSHTFEFSGGSDLTISLNGEHRSEYWSLGGAPGADIANPGRAYQDDYQMYNAYLNWISADGTWSINAFGRNLNNEVVQTNYSPSFGGSAEYVTLAPPRTYGVGVSVNF